ncbi:MAG: MFS transporter, partial [Halobacteriales archaeon]|nr:MFS transporter [Halobacteriales archaeon]
AERRAPDPLIPLSLFRNRTFALSTLATMFLAVGLFGVISFLPVFMQAVIGVTATSAGEVLTPLMIMIVAGSMLSGRLMPKTGFKPWVVVGPPIAAVGLVLLAQLGAHSGQNEAFAYLLLIGLGLGFTMATYVVAVQNEVQRRVMGVASSTLTLARSLGGTLGVALMGALLTSKLKDELAARLPPQMLAQVGAGGGGLESFRQFAGTPPLPVREALAASLDLMFLAAAAACVLALLPSLLIRGSRLKTREEYMGMAAAEGGFAPGAADKQLPAPVRALEAVAQAEAPVAVPMPPRPRWVAPRLVRVEHLPSVPEPGQPVETTAWLAPRDGEQRVRVEVWRGAQRVASEDATVPPEGAQVRLRWRAPLGNGPITTAVAPPGRALLTRR